MTGFPGWIARLSGCMLAGILTCAAATVSAQNAYPARPVTLVMPYGAGGPPDAYGRLFAQKLEQRIGQPVIVENRPGVGGTLGAAHVARAKPDGYTLLYGSASNITAAPALFKQLTYNPERDLAPVTLVAYAYYVLAAPAEVLSSMIQQDAGLDFTHVNYASSAPMISDLIGGRLSGVIHPVAGAVQLIADGAIAGVAVIAPKRLPAVPAIPTLNEVLPSIELGTWTGIFVPAGTPQSIIDYLYGHIREVLKDPEIVRISELGGTVAEMTPAEAREFVRRDRERWPGILREAGISPS